MPVDMAIPNNSVTELSEETLANYRAPYYAPHENHQEKRKALSAVLGAYGLQNFGAIAAENAVGLEMEDQCSV